MTLASHVIYKDLNETTNSVNKLANRIKYSHCLIKVLFYMKSLLVYSSDI